MNARTVIKASLVAALFAAGAAAQAAPVGEGDTLSGQPQQVQSSQSFTAAQASSLASAPRDISYFNEGFGTNVQAARRSQVDREAVRQAAIQAERSGAIEHGDAISF